MGGFLFTSGNKPLSTPRMPLEVYVQVRDRCQEILRRYYTYVDTPIEAPKSDYGDVDILVACPISLPGDPPVLDRIGEEFGAVQRSSTHGTSSFALPWPKDAGDNVGSEGSDSEKFVQVDIMVCREKQGWDWEMFHKAHGDLWNMVGSTIRRYGLTVNDAGLFLRIEEIELIDRKKSMIMLTNSPPEVLAFLGMDESKWWSQFESVRDLFDYAASCRLFWAKEKIDEIDEDKKQLKHNDRKRMNHRPIFRRWVEEFLPYCREHGLYSAEGPSRNQIAQEAFDRFGVKTVYDQRLQAWRLEKHIDDVWRRVVKTAVPSEDTDPVLRAAAIRGMKAIILEEDYSAGVKPSKDLKKEDGFYNVDEVVEFVERNWRRVGEIGLSKQAIRAAEAMEAKRLKRSQP